jgi:hypothetical protein
MAPMRYFEVILDKFNVIGMYIGERYKALWAFAIQN